jgi:hypothetical protein
MQLEDVSGPFNACSHHLFTPPVHTAVHPHRSQVQFEDESGFGSGVTQNFYSSVADELLKASVHDALPLWVTFTVDAAVSERIRHAGEMT